MYVGADMIGIVKINTKLLCSDTTKNLTKDFPGGYYLLLEIKYTVPRYRPLISIGYNHNSQKVIYIINI